MDLMYDCWIRSGCATFFVGEPYNQLETSSRATLKFFFIYPITHHYTQKGSNTPAISLTVLLAARFIRTQWKVSQIWKKKIDVCAWWEKSVLVRGTLNGLAGRIVTSGPHVAHPWIKSITLSEATERELTTSSNFIYIC